MLYDILFLYLFLPVFVGIYALTKPKLRPWLIAAANILMIAAADLRGLAVFAICLLTSYFSAILIYNSYAAKKPPAKRRLLLAANILLELAAFLLFAKNLAPTPLDGIRLLGAAVIPLHLISYLVDIYRRDCEPQVRLLPLAAFAAFFPSLAAGPLLRYKNFPQSFAAPKMSAAKLAEGVRSYVIGLAEYLLIARPLQEIWQGLQETRAELVRGAAVVIAALLFFVMLCTSITGLLYMGRGVALMLGFNIRPCGKRQLLRPSVSDYLFGINRPLAVWMKDYVYKPLKFSDSGAVSYFALLAAVICGAVWFELNVRWVAAAVVIATAMALCYVLRLRLTPLPEILKKILSAAFIFSVVTLLSIPSVTGGAGFIRSLTPSAAGISEEFSSYLFGISALRILAGLVMSSAAAGIIIKHTGTSWYRAAMPIVEAVLLMLCTAALLRG